MAEPESADGNMAALANDGGYAAKAAMIYRPRLAARPLPFNIRPNWRSRSSFE